MRRYALALACMMVFLVGCNTALYNEAYDNDEILARSGNSSLSTVSIGGRSGDTYTLRATMTGTQTLWSYDADDDCQVDITYSLTVTDGGKAKLVFIGPDDSVVTIVENADHTEMAEAVTATLHLQKGNNRIKLAGYDAPKLVLELTAPGGGE